MIDIVNKHVVEQCIDNWIDTYGINNVSPIIEKHFNNDLNIYGKDYYSIAKSYYRDKKLDSIMEQ